LGGGAAYSCAAVIRRRQPMGQRPAPRERLAEVYGVRLPTIRDDGSGQEEIAAPRRIES
jgi:hypothetical protein